MVVEVEDGVRILGVSGKRAADLLSRLAARGWLVRIRGKKAGAKYVITPWGPTAPSPILHNWFVLVREYMTPKPYYVSYYSAMALHNMTFQPINTIFISTPARPQKKMVAHVPVQLVSCQPQSLRWGVEDVWVTKQEQVKVSDLERTILDALDRPDYSGGVTELAKGLWVQRTSINWRLLMDYLHKMDRGAVYRRLGYLVETFRLKLPTPLAHRLHQQAHRYLGHVRLDPTLPHEGRYVPRWRLQVNVDPEELRRTAHT